MYESDIAGESEFKGWHARMSCDSGMYVHLAKDENVDPVELRDFIANDYHEIILVEYSSGMVDVLHFNRDQASDADEIMRDADLGECENGHEIVIGSDEPCEICAKEESEND